MMSAMAAENRNSGGTPVNSKEFELPDLPLHFQVPENSGKPDNPPTTSSTDTNMKTLPEPTNAHTGGVFNPTAPAYGLSSSNAPAGGVPSSNASGVDNGLAGQEGSQAQPVSKPHQCLECGKTFTRLDHLNRHMKTQKAHVHKFIEELGDSNGDKSDMYPHQCQDCGKSFTRSDHLNRHRRSHIGSRRCKCAQCGQWLPSRPARNQHMWESHGMQLFECGQCAWGFTKASYLTRHLREKHSDAATLDQPKSLHRPYTCGVCSMDFVRASQCSKHMEQHCQSGTHSAPQGAVMFPPAPGMKQEAAVQTVESQQFPVANSMANLQHPSVFHQMANQHQPGVLHQMANQHLSGVTDMHGRHICPDCGREFSRTDHLAAHMNRHTGCRPFCCGVCGMDFSQAQDLKTHMRKHRGSKPFACKICQATFANSSNMMRHEQMHTGEKPFKCTMCASSFPHRGALVSHERTHTGHRPFSCELCGAKFARTDALKRHRRTHKELRTQNQPTAAGSSFIPPVKEEAKSYVSL